MTKILHLDDELYQTRDTKVKVDTVYGTVIGGRALNGSVVFLEVPYALTPKRFEDPVPLPRAFRYPTINYIHESTYCVQPLDDGQSADVPPADKFGHGKPSENPCFLNIVIPPSFPAKKGFPVKVYIHGGFLQYGSPHGLSSQAQFVAAQRSEVWVNIGYRLSAFGFLASDKRALSGNYGFKDQWVGLQWVKDNIHHFGGDPSNISLTGLSAGAHSVHQILHHVAVLPEKEPAPFQAAVLQSNGLLMDPKTPKELRPQFVALCNALGLDPDAPDILDTLRDRNKVRWESITSVIETQKLGAYGTFRGCLSADWISVSPRPMELQRTGELARRLKAKGIRSIVIGDLKEEWYLYSIAHPIHSPKDILPNVERYFPTDVATTLIESFPKLPDNAPPDQAVRRYGDVMSCAQVHLPVRLFAKDFQESGLPVLRYEIRWTPEQHRPFGYVTHGCDRVIWALREPSLEKDQLQVAKQWLDRIDKEVEELKSKGTNRKAQEVFTLSDDRKFMEWKQDGRWDELSRIQAKLDALASSSF